MSRNIFSRFLLTVLLLAAAGTGVRAQSYGAFTPYSIFGVGDLLETGSAYNRSMGGVGIATRSPRFINVVNPASITSRDSLSFMTDYSMYQDNKYFSQSGMKSVGNTLSLADLVISFPITRHSAMMVGIMPYSSTGYGYNSIYGKNSLVADTGPVVYTANGRGSIYQAFAAGAVTFWNRLSLGAEAIYYFGHNEKLFTETFSNSGYNGAANGDDFDLSGWTGKFGLQYEQPLSRRSTITVGATYRLQTQLQGTVQDYRYSVGSAVTDTLYNNVITLGTPGNDVRLAGELGVGISYHYGDRLLVSADYTRADWTGSGLDKTPGFAGNLIPGTGHSIFTTAVSQTYRLGGEFVPNRNDVRYYFNRCAYRGGIYHKQEYYLLDGHHISSTGVTLGITLPVYGGYNGITLGVDFGQRGTVKDNLIRERYINFSIGFNLYDIWFRRLQYQ